MPIEISSKSEFKKYTGQSKLTVVDFYADWCGPCKAIAPRFEQLSAQYPNVNFLKVNVDTQQDISTEEGVSAMPTFIFYKNGLRMHTITGADINGITRFIQSNQGVQTFSGTGHKLGSNSTAGSATTATTAGSSWGMDQVMIAGLVALFAYLYFNK